MIDNVRLAALWERVTPVEADLRNADSLAQIRSIEPEIVYHMAAYNHVGDSFLHVQESLNSNLIGTANLMEAYSGYQRFVYISTSEVYGHQEQVPFQEDMTPFPTSPYAVGKYAGEVFARMHWHVKKTPITFIRPFNVFGPYQSPRAVVAEIILQCLSGKPVIATEGRQTREFNYVENSVEGILLASLSEDTIGETINIGTGEEISIRDLIVQIHRVTGSHSDLRIGELPHRPTEIWRMYCDATRIRQLVGWTPRLTFEQGLERTIAWYRKYIAVFCNPGSPLLEL